MVTLFGEGELMQPPTHSAPRGEQRPIRRHRHRYRSSSSSSSVSSSRYSRRSDHHWHHQPVEPAAAAASAAAPAPEPDAAFSAVGEFNGIDAADAAAAAPEEEPDEPVIHRSRYVDFDKYQQDPDDPILQPNFCVFCHVAMSTKQMEMNRLLQSLLDLQKHHRSYMAPLSFCRMQQDEYNENIRPHIVDKYGRRYKDARGAPAMAAKQFWEHHISHIYSPAVFHEELAREVSGNLLLMLQNGSKLKTRKRGVYVDEDKFWNAARIYDKFKGLLTSVGSGRDTTLYGAT